MIFKLNINIAKRQEFYWGNVYKVIIGKTAIILVQGGELSSQLVDLGLENA